MVKKLQHELWWWVFNILHGSMEMLLHRLDTVGRGLKAGLCQKLQVYG